MGVRTEDKLGLPLSQFAETGRLGDVRGRLSKSQFTCMGTKMVCSSNLLDITEDMGLSINGGTPWYSHSWMVSSGKSHENG